MDFLRRGLGYATATPIAAETKEEPIAVDVNRLARAQDQQLRKLQARGRALEVEKQEAISQGNKVTLTRVLQQQRKNAADVNQLQGIINNQRGVQDTIASAASNRDTALVMKAGAQQLDSIVKETETIDVDGIVDQLQESSVMSHEFGSRLSEPMFGSGSTDEVEVDDEVDALMRTRISMPDAPTGTITRKEEKQASKVPL